MKSKTIIRVRGTVALAAVGVGVLLIAGCAGGSPTSSADAEAAALAWVEENIPDFPASLVKEACEEGAVTFYTLPGGAEEVNAVFMKDIPCINAEVFTSSGGPLVQRFLSESNAGKHIADVLQPSSPTDGDELVEQGLITEYTPPTASGIPDQWQRPGYYYANSVCPQTLSWNTDAVSEEQLDQLRSVTTWEEALDVEGLAGKTGAVNIVGGGTAQAFWSTMADTYGTEFFAQVEGALDPTFATSVVQSGNLLAAGQQSIIFGAIDCIPAYLQADGAPLEWVYPKPYISTGSPIMISSNAPHPAAAKLFEAWNLSERGMQATVDLALVAPITPDVEDTRPFTKESWYQAPDVTEFTSPDWTAINEELPATTDAFDKAFGQ